MTNYFVMYSKIVFSKQNKKKYYKGNEKLSDKERI